MEASGTTPRSCAYFAFRTLTNVLTQMEEHGPPNRVDRSFLSGMSGAGQTQFIHGLKSLGLIDENGRVQPALTSLVTDPEERPRVMGQLIRERYPEAVELGNGNATTGELVDSFKNVFGVQGDTARKAIAFYLAAAKYAGDVPLSPNFRTPTVRTGAGTRRRSRASASGGVEQPRPSTPTDIPAGLHPALSGLLGDIPKRGQTWTQGEHDDFMAAFKAVIKIAAPVSDPADEEANDEDAAVSMS